MNTVNIFHEAMMHIRGFKKVKLNDTKGVLTETNNHKWVKDFSVDNIDVGLHILPSGTVVQTFTDRMSPITQKNVIKPDNSGIRIFKGIGGVDGSYDLSRVKEYKKYGNIFLGRPLYEPSVFGERLAYKSPEEVQKKLIENKRQWEKTKLQAKRKKFIADFNKKYERKTINGANGAKSKYVIDKETGNIVQFFRKDTKGNTMSGTISYNGVFKIIDITTPKADIHKEITELPSGKYITTTTISEDGKIKNSSHLVSKKGEAFKSGLEIDYQRYLNFILDGLNK